MKYQFSLLFTALLVSGSLVSASDITREFKVTSAPDLALRNIAGEIKVSPGKSDRVVIHVDRDDDDIEVDMFQSGSRINIKVRYPNRTNFGNRGDVNFKIELPNKCNNLELHSVSGSIEVVGIQSQMNLQTVSGDLEITRCSGEMKLNAVSGDIDLDELGSSGIDASTISGDVVYRDANLEGGDYSFSSTSGDIRITHGASASYRISGRTISGNISNDVADSIEVKRNKYSSTKSISGFYNGEAVWIEAHSVSGNISLRLK